MYRNVASQKLHVFAFDYTTGAPKTGDAANITAYVSKDYGSVTVLGDTSATEMSSTNAPGWYLFNLTQGETDAHDLLFTGKSSTPNITVVAQPYVTTDWAFKKNKALSNFEFTMTDSTDHNPATGKTVTMTRSIDGGSFGAGTIGSVTEVAYGVYKVDLPAADLNGTVVTLRATATGCDDLFMTLVLEP